MRKVLVVDDNEENRMILRDLLQFHGWKCQEAGNGKEALTLLENGLPNLVITDLEMPVMNGLDFLAEMTRQQLTRTVAVILVSGNITENVRQRAMALGARAVFSKPYEFHALISAIGAVMSTMGERHDPSGKSDHLLQPMEILLVEDHPGDVRLTKEALKETQVPTNLHVVNDGVEALAFLRQEKPRYAMVPRPNLILLDLNLPKKNGHEVLKEIKMDPALRQISVVVLSSSGYAQDVRTSHDLYANCHVIKPVDLDQFMNVVKTIVEFLSTVAKLPNPH